jgi:hypothetical protein
VEAGTVMKNYSSILVLLLRLRQSCLHPDLTKYEMNPEEAGRRKEERQASAKAMPESVVHRILHDSDNVSEVEVGFDFQNFQMYLCLMAVLVSHLYGHGR